MTSVGIYARYSSDRQSERSIDDQIELCRAYAERQGWRIADVYADYAISGASIVGRSAYERLIADARRGALTVILAEDLDRLSRSQADTAWLFERMTFSGVEIWTVADGRVSEMHIGLKGTMSALFLKNLAAKTHRGLQGRIREGKSAGGRCYGYRVVGTGDREIEAAEAAIVLRIFEEFAGGSPPREIAARLNREGVAGPRGGQWNASTINGSRERANGILRNELYVGRLVWNRQRFVKDPDTGKRISRPNAEAERKTADVPALRIVPQDLWNRVHARIAARSQHGAHERRPRHLLSGLCRCGSCGGSFIVSSPSQLGCSTRRERGTCDNRRLISISLIERRVVEAMQEHLLHPDVIEKAAEAYIAERRAARREAGRHKAQREKRLGEIERETTRLVDLIATGALADPRPVAERLNALSSERDSLLSAPAPQPDVIEFHPAVVKKYRDAVTMLREEIEKANPERKAEVVSAAREMIESVVIYPRDDAAGRDIELHGTLAALLGVTEQGRSSMSPMVAGAGFEPAAFRL